MDQEGKDWARGDVGGEYAYGGDDLGNGGGVCVVMGEFGLI